MPGLVEKLRKSREGWIDVKDFKLKIRRPTQEEAVEFTQDKPLTSGMLAKYVIGWDGLKERHLFPEGGEDEIPFDPEAVQEVVSDMVDEWTAIGTGIVDLFSRHMKARVEDPNG